MMAPALTNASAAVSAAAAAYGPRVLGAFSKTSPAAGSVAVTNPVTLTWTASTGVITTDAGQAARTGSYKAWLNGYGQAATDTLSQSVTIPSGCKATLSFYVHIDTAETTTTTAYDKLTVKAGSTTLATYSNLNAATGYVLKSFDVSSLAGQTVTIGFSGTALKSIEPLPALPALVAMAALPSPFTFKPPGSSGLTL